MRCWKQASILKAVALCMLLASSASHSVIDIDSAERYQLNVKSQTVEQALRSLANASNRQLLFPYDQMEALKSISISGRYTLEEALGIILKDTSLSGELTTEGVILVTPIQKKSDRGRDMNSKRNILAATIGFFVGVGGAQQALAEETQSGEEMGWLLEEVIVTAQKREEKLIDVPISISVIGEDAIKTTGIKNMNDLSYLVPNLSVANSNSGSQNIIIRGINNTAGLSPLIGIYLDEIPLTVGTGISVDVQAIDIQRVEVLRGPQGTLYGQGSAGGTIRFISKKPNLNGIEGEMGLSVSNTTGGGRNKDLTGVINIPMIDDTLAFRVAATFKDKSGWIDQPTRNIDDANDTELSNINARGLWQASEDLEINVTAIQYRNDTGGFNLTNLGPVIDSNYQPTFRNGLDFPSTDMTNDFDLYNLTLSYDFGFATLVSSSSQIDFENTRSSISNSQIFNPAPGIRADILISDSHDSADVFSQEIRLAGDTSTLDWVIGVFYRDLEFGGPKTFGQYVNGVALFTPLRFTQLHTSESKAIFANLSYHINDQLTLDLGTRYFENDKTSKAPAFLLSEKGKFDNISSKASLSYGITEQSTAYFSIAEGFRSGGFNSAGVDPYEPESIISYELGVKGSLLDKRLNVEAAMFLSQYDDYQAGTIDEETGFPITGNPGEAEIQGIELSTLLNITEQLSIGFSANITDAEFTTVDPDVSLVNIGDPLFLVPKFSYSLSADYYFNWSSAISGFAHLDYNRQGENTEINRSPASFNQENKSTDIGFLNAQIGAQWEDITIRLFGRNLNNELRTTIGSLAGIFTQNRPRTVGVDINYQF